MKVDNRFLTDNLKNDITKLGGYQIFGGVLGFVMMGWKTILPVDWADGIFLFGLTLALCFFSFSIYCGFLCIKLKGNFLRLSLVNQLLQIVSFSVIGLSYKFFCGVYFTVGLDLTRSFSINFGLGLSDLHIGLFMDQELAIVNFNLIAFAVVYWVDKLSQRVKTEKNFLLTSSIGA
ncbi:hypothetical protein [Parasegetibacter sp. NRK P23]|uniref:hypothetical protein n=1 Tax=Parasegetibacter sp. NRK P23 TaxID=2942999 RepID=UPI0020444CE8|nr:hypothetical protein [Parasegetibacter sp. NRK P23]MCM5530258.1 hypothetical protein [Parasegetibacter sp. NRK P23]